MRLLSFFAFCAFNLCLVAPCTLAESRPMGLTETAEIGAPATCVELLKECFAYDAAEKANCFRVSSNHPFCLGSDLGELAAKRWGMSPNQGGDAAAPAITGPQFIDTECVANFDARWSSYLISGNISRDTMRQLDTTLSGCAKAPANEIFRP